MVLNDTRTVFFNVVGHDAWTLLSGPVSDAFATWDMTTSIGPIAGDGTGGFWHPQYGNIVDQIHVAVDGPVTFTASVADSPIPEPGTLALMGGGLLALALYRKRMRKA